MELAFLLRINEPKLRGLHPTLANAAREIIKASHSRGVYVRITQGLRTLQEQARLYSQGRTAPGPIVTNARPGYSWHNFGLAIDFAIYTPDGKKILWDTKIDQDRDGKADWLEVVEEAKRRGLRWGGDWTKFKDYPHFELYTGKSLSQYRAKPSLAYWTSGHNSTGAAQTGGNKNMLKKGGNNDEAAVRALQMDLMSLGYDLPKFGADGSFGDELEAAVKKYQKDKKMPVDGIAGPATLAAIEKDKIAKKKLAEATPSPAHAAAVKWAQSVGLSDGSNPWDPTSRQQTIQMFYNFYNLLMNKEGPVSPRFQDAYTWAREEGVSDGSKPGAVATREQVIQMVYSAARSMGGA